MSSDLNQPTFEHLSSQNNPDTAKRYIKNYHGTVWQQLSASVKTARVKLTLHRNSNNCFCLKSTQFPVSIVFLAKISRMFPTLFVNMLFRQSEMPYNNSTNFCWHWRGQSWTCLYKTQPTGSTFLYQLLIEYSIGGLCGGNILFCKALYPSTWWKQSPENHYPPLTRLLEYPGPWQIYLSRWYHSIRAVNYCSVVHSNLMNTPHCKTFSFS